MARLVERIDALAGAIRDKFNQIMPRLLPPGGTTGQALVKASNASNSVVWASIEGGGGTSGPITSNQLPINRGAAGTFRYPARIQTDEYGRVAIAVSGSQPASNRGEWDAIAYYETASFGFGSIPERLTTVGVPVYVELDDEPNGQYTALQLPKITMAGSTAQAGQLGFTVNTSPSFNVITVTYKLLGTSNQAFFQVLAGKKRVMDSTVDGQWKTATLVLPVGLAQVGIAYSDAVGSEANQVLISQITYPADTYSFGDVVTYDGRSWQCMQVSTEEVPGSGSEWVEIGNNLLPSNNLWNGTNRFAGSVELNGTATAVTAAAGTSSTQIATTEFVASATGALTPRLVPLAGSSGQNLSRDGSGNLVWSNVAAAVGFYCGGKPGNAELIGRVHAAQTFNIVAANCKVTSDTAATASATVTIKKNGTAIGTAAFAAGGTTATVSITTAAVTKGDLITFHAPDTADATLANVSGTISN